MKNTDKIANEIIAGSSQIQKVLDDLITSHSCEKVLDSLSDVLFTLSVDAMDEESTNSKFYLAIKDHIDKAVTIAVTHSL